MIDIVLSICLFLCIVAIVVLYLQKSSLQKSNSKVVLVKDNFKIISQEANDIILVIDIVSGKIYQANNKAAEMLAYSMDELLTKSIFDLHARDLLLKSSETIAQVWENKGMVYQDLPFVTSNGVQLDVECSAKVLEYNKKPVVVIYARDIRQRLKMENEIKQKTIVIANKNKDILGSIVYAKRIQKAILPPDEYVKQHLKNSFIFYEPKDIVSGDFYWIEKKNDSIYVAVVDCTGHGVPGAFLSVLGNSALHRAVFEQDLDRPSDILNRLNELVIGMLRQKENTIKDGMDISLCCIDNTRKKLEFAGANNSLFLMRKNGLPLPEGKVEEGRDYSLVEIAANRQPIGNYYKKAAFTNKEFDILEGDSIYLTTDGYIDQFGGAKGRKFMRSNFRKLLFSIFDDDFEAQKKKLQHSYIEWKNDYEQVDDVCVIGLSLN